MPLISVRVIQWPALQLVGLVVLMALVGVAAPARTSGRRLGVGLSWLDPADTEDVPAAMAIGGLDLVGGYGGGGGAPSRDSATFDADLDVDLAVDEVGDNMIVAQPERAEAPPTAAKRTLQDICDNIAVKSRDAVAGYLRTGLLQCSCDNGFEPVMLGDLHYPHRIPQVRCLAAPHCRMRYYDMPLLTKGKTVREEAGMPLVPNSLREHWRFEFKKIAVACECVHPDLNGK